MSEVVIRQVFVTLIQSVAFVHSMLDPHGAWKQNFFTDDLELKRDQSVGVVTVPVEVVPFFVAVVTLSDMPLHYGHCSVEFASLQTELLHMMGALLSSDEVITVWALSPECRVQSGDLLTTVINIISI